MQNQPDIDKKKDKPVHSTIMFVSDYILSCAILSRPLTRDTIERHDDLPHTIPPNINTIVTILIVLDINNLYSSHLNEIKRHNSTVELSKVCPDEANNRTKDMSSSKTIQESTSTSINLIIQLGHDQSN